MLLGLLAACSSTDTGGDDAPPTGAYDGGGINDGGSSDGGTEDAGTETGTTDGGASVGSPGYGACASGAVAAEGGSVELGTTLFPRFVSIQPAPGETCASSTWVDFYTLIGGGEDPTLTDDSRVLDGIGGRSGANRAWG